MENSIKSFWQRPEGTTAKTILTSLAIGGGLLVWYKILPFLLAMALGTLQLAAIVGVLGLILVIVTSDRFQALGFYALAVVSRWITSVFVNIDPVSILKEFQKQMVRKAELLDEKIQKIGGQKQKLRHAIAEAKAELEEAVRKAQAAGSDPKYALDRKLQLERAGRREKKIERLTVMSQAIDKVMEAMMTIRQRVRYNIETSADEMAELIQQNELAKAQAGALADAKSVLSVTEMLNIRSEAADHIRDKYNSSLGEIDTLLELGKDLDSEIALSRIADEKDGEAALARLTAKLEQIDAPTTTVTARIITEGPAQPLKIGNGSTTDVLAERLRNRNTK